MAPLRPSLHWQGDFCQLPKAQGYQYVLTLICVFSKWLEAFPCQMRTPVTKVSPEQIFPTWGIATTVSRDRGSHFIKITRDIEKAAH